jgi:hypothetical protein
MHPEGNGGAGDASVWTDGAPAPGIKELQGAAEAAAAAARGAERKVAKQRQFLADAEDNLVAAVAAEEQAKAAVEAEYSRWKAENGAG